jgi:hypothetical protein
MVTSFSGCCDMPIGKCQFQVSWPCDMSDIKIVVEQGLLLKNA